MTIHAVYENGVFRPTVKVDLPDACEVEVEIRKIGTETKIPTLDDVYAILGRRHASGVTTTFVLLECGNTVARRPV